MTRQISNFDDVIDSRNVIARIEELRAEYAEVLEAGAVDGVPAQQAWEESDDGLELAALEALEREASGSPDWQHGETLIRESYFQDYAQQLAEDCGMVPDDLKWPLTCIDWERAARELRYDYSAADFDGVTYLIRS